MTEFDLNELNNKPEIFNPTFNPDELKRLYNNVYLPIDYFLPGALAAAVGNYGTFFPIDRSYEVIAITESHSAVGTVGSPTITIEKCPSGTADGGAGCKNLLATDFSLIATVFVPQFGKLTLTKADLVLKKGDRLASKSGGTLTSVAGIGVGIVLRAI